MIVRIEHRRDGTIHAQVNGKEITMPMKGRDVVITPKKTNDNYEYKTEENIYDIGAK